MNVRMRVSYSASRMPRWAATLNATFRAATGRAAKSALRPPQRTKEHDFGRVRLTLGLTSRAETVGCHRSHGTVAGDTEIVLGGQAAGPAEHRIRIRIEPIEPLCCLFTAQPHCSNLRDGNGFGGASRHSVPACAFRHVQARVTIGNDKQPRAVLR